MVSDAKESISAAIDARHRLVRWYDNARKRRDAPRPTGGRRDAISEIMGFFQRDIMGGPDRLLVHRIPLPSAASAEETLYLFPGHRAIYEIRLLFGRRHHFITFIECDRDAEPRLEDRNLIEAKLAASLPGGDKLPKSKTWRGGRPEPPRLKVQALCAFGR